MQETNEGLVQRDPANMEWQVDVAISCFIFGSLDSLQIFQQRREYLAKGLNLLTALKQAGRLHANKDWTGWFNNSLRSLKSIAQSLIYRQKTSEQALRVDRLPPFLSLAPPPPRLPLRSSVSCTQFPSWLSLSNIALARCLQSCEAGLIGSISTVTNRTSPPHVHVDREGERATGG